MEYEQLKLSNQLCFPIYAASRLVTRVYQPYLEALDITYPQYLVLLVLWEVDEQPVNDIAQKLLLNTNTITPLLKRMEGQNIITRARSTSDERKVIVKLTPKGKTMQVEAARIPQELAANLITGSLKLEELIDLKDKLNAIIAQLSK